MKKFRYAFAAILVGQYALRHRGAVGIELRRNCVNWGIHFPIPFTGKCICGLPLRMLSGALWLDKSQFAASFEEALSRHAAHQELAWWRNLKAGNRIAVKPVNYDIEKYTDWA